jgi:RecA/RadA recombinase
MAWWDHEELKSPKDRSARYIVNFPQGYTKKEIEAAKKEYEQDKLDRIHKLNNSDREISVNKKPKQEKLMAKSIFATLLKESGNEYAALAEDGIAAGDVSGFVDTGSLTFNAALSGSIWGGLASNKVTALAGEPSTGKTFFALSIAKDFLEKNKDGFVFYFETESAISKDMLVSRGIDTKRMAIVPVATVQEFRTQAVKILDTYSESEERPPMFFVLDSLGGLSTDKEITDIEAGKDTRDMTRAQLIRGAFRVLTLKLGKANVALLVTNHVYEVVGSYVPTKKMGGGSGLDYAASTVVFLSKSKNRDKDKKVTGAIITAAIKKGRLTVEETKVETLLDFEKGLDRYYGLLDLALEFGIVKKAGNKGCEFPDGTTASTEKIEKEPEKYFTKDILDAIDIECQKHFKYGGHKKKTA